MLLGPVPGPAALTAWAAACDAWQVTVIDHAPAGPLRALADRLAGRSLGLVLAGGGARAFAHIGVLRELEDAGLHVDRVAGSSVGAIVAAEHATGVDGSTLEEICYAEFVRRRPFSDWTAAAALAGHAAAAPAPPSSGPTAPTPCSRACRGSCTW